MNAEIIIVPSVRIRRFPDVGTHITIQRSIEAPCIVVIIFLVLGSTKVIIKPRVCGCLHQIHAIILCLRIYRTAILHMLASCLQPVVCT